MKINIKNSTHFNSWCLNIASAGLLGCLLSQVPTLAQEQNGLTSNSKIKAQQVEPEQSTKHDVDDEITNARLRATTGAKSKVSLQTEFAYIGGSINDPAGKNRPQLSPGPVTPTKTKLSGSISAKIRLDEKNHINIGSGVGWVTPGYQEQTTQLENPYVSYSHVSKFSGLQNVFSFSFTKYYAKDYSADTQPNFQLEVANTILGELPNSKWQLGTAFAIDNEVYSRFSDENAHKSALVAGLFPFAEYAFNSRYSFRTVYRGFTFYSERDNTNKYLWDEATQSMGLGIAVNRDLYFYPNIQWVWRDIRSDKTNVALSANINF